MCVTAYMALCFITSSIACLCISSVFPSQVFVVDVTSRNRKKKHTILSCSESFLHR